MELILFCALRHDDSEGKDDMPSESSQQLINSSLINKNTNIQ